MNIKIVLISICLSLLQEYGSAAVIAAGPLGIPLARPIVAPGVVRTVVPVVVPRPAVINRFGIVGKRDVNSNLTDCVLNTEERKLTCTGEHELTCEISKRLGKLETPLSVIVKDLVVKLAKTKSENNDILMNIHAEKEVDKKITIEDYTFLNPITNKPVFLSLYSSDNFKNKLGFQFKEDSCLKKFKELFNEENKQEDRSFQLVIKIENSKPSVMETTTSTTSNESTTAAAESTTAAATARDATGTTTEATTTSEAATTTTAAKAARDATGATTEAATTTTAAKAARDATGATTTEAAITTTAAATARDATGATTETVTTHDATATTSTAASARDATAVDATTGATTITTTAANKI